MEINKFTGIQPSIFSEQQETEATSEQSPSQTSSVGIGSTPDAFETFQPSARDELNREIAEKEEMVNRLTQELKEAQDSNDASSFFDWLTGSDKGQNVEDRAKGHTSDVIKQSVIPEPPDDTKE